MISSMSDGVRAFNNYQNGYPDHKCKFVVRELKKALKDPKISDDEKMRIAERIARIESRAKSSEANADLANLAISVSGVAASNLLGPVGTGLHAFGTGQARRGVQAGRAKIRPARKVAGRRRRPARKKGRAPASSGMMPTTASVVEGISAGAIAFGAAAALVSAGGMAARTWNSLSSYFLGE